MNGVVLLVGGLLLVAVIKLIMDRDVYKRQTQKIFDFRDKLEEVFTTDEGSEVLTLTGEMCIRDRYR